MTDPTMKDEGTITERLQVWQFKQLLNRIEKAESESEKMATVLQAERNEYIRQTLMLEKQIERLTNRVATLEAQKQQPAAKKWW
jgi:hypothetical protein